jgi:hypothetical protein
MVQAVNDAVTLKESLEELKNEQECSEFGVK